MDEYHQQVIARGVVFSRTKSIEKSVGLRKFHKPEIWNVTRLLNRNLLDLTHVRSEFLKESKSGIIQDLLPYTKYINEYEDGEILESI